jgi:uncharacterized membrane protein
MLLVLVPVGVATLVGLLVLWPSGGPSRAERAGAASVAAGTTYPTARVVSVERYDCSLPAADGTTTPLTCARAVVRIEDGDSAGEYQQVELPPEVSARGVDVDDRLVLSRDPGADGGASYTFTDLARGTPIVVLAVAFVLVVGAVARSRGLRALLGLVIAFVVLLRFVLPALLAGESPTLVSLVGSSAIMMVVLYLAHGFSARTTTALLGTLFGLALVTGLGGLAVAAARLTGFAGEETLQLQQFDPGLDFSALVIAGVVVAGLGVLNDVTITQASAIWQLHETDPALGWRQLFTRGMAIGRDHIASTVYTIVFAYAGAALPLLLLFEVYSRPTWTVLTSEAVAEEVVRTLVGAIALVLAVPLTTVVGAAVATASRATASRAADAAPPAAEPTDTRARMGR